MLDVDASLPRPDPDVERLKAVLRKGKPDRVPLVELAIADEILAAVAGKALAPWPVDRNPQQARAWAADRVEVWRRLGFDYYRARAEIPFRTHTLAATDTAMSAAGDRVWVDEHAGVIQSAADLERYPWPKPAEIDFAPTEAAINVLPEGMGVIGFSGGVLEWTTNIMGLENMMLLLYDDPALVRQVVDHVGEVIYSAFETFCSMDSVFAIWLGDDMGFRTATLIRPEHLREYILPWHHRYAELAHRTGRPFLLHSCGHIEAIMPDLIDTVGIDAKHSFEDAIVPVEQFKERWGGRIGVLGGLDVDILARQPVERIRERTEQILNACAPSGGYACGSGNSIPNYVPPTAFLAMIETVHRFNARL
ncbi:MAG: uroporphyrinogen-III decarboxylase-like protein [Phycisphaerae bacterium]|nr:uroporphyrinogen-III decarboxylase-like protein [Phycisphaerae bacterium]